MPGMTRLYRIAGAIMVGALAGPLFMAADRTFADPAEESGRTVVVELFTSQGCYSCPPAEAFLGELAERSDVVALEFHVDYWDELVYGAAGKWKDPFSSPEATQRQKLYARSFGTGRIYTPQMVVDGQLEGVGSNRRMIHSAIKRAKERTDTVSLEAAREPSGALTVKIDAPQGAQGTLWLVTFTRNSTTRVLAGENKGKTLTSHNIVKDLVKIDDWDGRSGSVMIPEGTVEHTDGCAIFVQPEPLGPIASAAYCPSVQSQS